MIPVMNQAASAIHTLARSLSENSHKISSYGVENVAAQEPVDETAETTGYDRLVQGESDIATAMVDTQIDKHAIEANVQMIKAADDMVGTLLDIVV